MPILLPLLFAAATMTGPDHATAPHSRTIAAAQLQTPLSAVIAAAARHQSPLLSRGLRAPSSQRGPVRGGYRARHSLATRATAIFAGAVLGSLAGIVAGGAFDAATSHGECLTGMAYGMPIGAGVGAYVTAKWVR